MKFLSDFYQNRLLILFMFLCHWKWALVFIRCFWTKQFWELFELSYDLKKQKTHYVNKEIIYIKKNIFVLCLRSWDHYGELTKWVWFIWSHLILAFKITVMTAGSSSQANSTVTFFSVISRFAKVHALACEIVTGLAISLNDKNGSECYC